MENQLVKAGSIPEVTLEKLTKFLDFFGASNKLSEKEKTQFIEICIDQKLNPFKREVHLVAYGEGKNRTFNIITGYEVYIKRANLSERLDSWSTPVIEKCQTARIDKKGNLDFIDDIKATISIKRKDFSAPFVHSVKLSEYIQRTKYGDVTSFWLKPESQLKKVAISQGFRLCFSEILGGMPYEQSEISDYKTVNIDSFQQEKKSTVPKINSPSPIEPKVLKELLPENTDVWKNVFEAMTREENPVLFEEVEQKFSISEENKKEMTNQVLDFHIKKEQENV